MNTSISSSDQATPFAGNRVWMVLLLVSFVMPFFFYAGSLKLSAYRVVLLALFFPVMYFWMSGRAGQIRAVDFLVLLVGFWPPIALIANHGVAMTWEFSGMYIIEAITPYFIARTMIRDFRSYKFFVWTLVMVVMALLPFAIYENVSGRAILIEMFDKVFDVYKTTDKDPRLGLRRAQATLPHPILFGLFCSPVFALALYTLRTKSGRMPKLRYPVVVFAAVFTSLSSGAFTSVAAQMVLILWDFVLRKVKKRWKIFLVLVAILYVILEVGSNRSVYNIAASTLTFNAGNSYNRVLILEYSADDIAANPIFGLGYREWTRPFWMKPSVDNFWLLQVLAYGWPALFAYVSSMLTLFVQASRAQLDVDQARARTGFIIAMIGMSLAVSSVHMWESVFCLFMFILGAGVWFIDARDESDLAAPPETNQPHRQPMQYTRFPNAQAGE